MGSAMASNLIRAGHQVTVYNRSRGKVEALAAEGAAGCRIGRRRMPGRRRLHDAGE